MSASDLERDPDVQHVDVRLFFPADTDPGDFTERLAAALQDSPDLCDLTAAYQVEADSKPLA